MCQELQRLFDRKLYKLLHIKVYEEETVNAVYYFSTITTVYIERADWYINRTLSRNIISRNIPGATMILGSGLEETTEQQAMWFQYLRQQARLKYFYKLCDPAMNCRQSFCKIKYLDKI